jgi:hypothetical protein
VTRDRLIEIAYQILHPVQKGPIGLLHASTEELLEVLQLAMLGMTLADSMSLDEGGPGIRCGCSACGAQWDAHSVQEVLDGHSCGAGPVQ